LLKDYKAIITGGSTGIGLAIARDYVKNGANVWLVARDEAKLISAQKELDGIEQGKTCFSIADLGKLEDVQKFSDEVGKEWDSLNVLVNNAAIGRFKPFDLVNEDDIEMHFSLNIYAPYRLTQRLLPLLEKSKGSIINITSYFAQRMLPMAPSSVYSATKGAVNAWTKAIAVELGVRGIRVNAIAPGTVKTPTVDHNISVMPEDNKKALNQYIKQNYALKRVGEPEEVSGIAVYLASDKASWVTGSIFNIDGGLTAT